MIIAVPTRENKVDDHFGHCESYTLFTIGVDNNITKRESVPAPQGCGCKSNIASVLREKGVEIMLAGNMGNGALNVLSAQNIKVIRGCKGNIEDVIRLYLAGDISDSGVGCDLHVASDHQCGNHN